MDSNAILQEAETFTHLFTQKSEFKEFSKKLPGFSEALVQESKQVAKKILHALHYCEEKQLLVITEKDRLRYREVVKNMSNPVKQQPYTLQEVLAISDTTLAQIYEEVLVLFNEPENEELLEDLLIFLCTINPYISSFWHGLGALFHKKGAYESAVQLYGISYQLSKYPNASFIPLVRCLKEVVPHQDVVEFIEMAKRQRGDIEEWKVVFEKVETFLEGGV